MKDNNLNDKNQMSGAEPLTCLNSNNGTKTLPDSPKTKRYLDKYTGLKSVKEDQLKALIDSGLVDNIVIDQFITPYGKKAIYTLCDNCERFIKEVGIENVGFLTLTFVDNVTDHKEANRRFKKLCRILLNVEFGRWMRVSERQKRGSWHFHCLIDCKADVRSGFDFKAVEARVKRKKGGSYSSVSKRLKYLWKRLRECCRECGFGSNHLFPVESNLIGIAKYLGKYMGKHNCWREPRDKGVRLTGYSGKSVRSNSQFVWNSPGAKAWRRKLSKFAEYCGIKDLDRFHRAFGPKWAYMLRPFIMTVDEFDCRTIRKFYNTLRIEGPPLDLDSVVIPSGELIDLKSGEVIF